MFVFLSQERVAAFVQVTCFERAIPSGHTHQCFHHKIFPGLMVVWCWLSKRDGGIGALSTYGENDKLLFTTLLTDLSQQSQQVPSEKKTTKHNHAKKIQHLIPPTNRPEANGRVLVFFYRALAGQMDTTLNCFLRIWQMHHCFSIVTM